MQTQTLDLIADQIVFINLDITCWSGKKTLTPEDLGLDRTQLPPESLVSLGDKQLIDPKALREFSTLRSAARRYCLAVGTRFMGGYIVPVSKVRDLLQRLSELEQQYHDKRADFLAHFDGLVTNWTCQQPPEWQRLIREALVPSESVGERLSFAVQAVRLGAPDPEVVSHHGLNDAVGGLSAQLFHEIAVIARETLDKSFTGKSEVTRRALSPFNAIREKLDGLSFIDSRVRPIVNKLDQLLAGIPPKQAITGRMLQDLVDFLAKAAQPDTLKAYADERATRTVDVMAGSGLDFSVQGPPEAPKSSPDGVLLYENHAPFETDAAIAESVAVSKRNAEVAFETSLAASERDDEAVFDMTLIDINSHAVIAPASVLNADEDVIDPCDEAPAEAVSAETDDEGGSWFF